MTTRHRIPPELERSAASDGRPSPSTAPSSESHAAAKSDVGPARRKRTGRRLPIVVKSSLDDFLRAAALLPVEEGAEAVARAVIDVIRASRPNCAVGVVLPGEGAGGDPLYVTAAPLVPSVASATPQPIAPVAPRETDPGRLFPWLDDEIIVNLPAPKEDVSLHVAGEVDVDGELDARLQETIERAAIVLSAGLAAVRRMRSMRGSATELRDLQARIVHAEKLASVGQIAAKVVHELNNPLTAIVAYSDYLRKKLQIAGHEREDIDRLERIGGSAQRILRFSRELTAYARPADEDGEPVSVREIVERSIVFCEHDVAPLGIEVTTTIDPSTPTVFGRKGQLTQIFVNLITNACHAIQDARSEGGAIEIIASPRDDGGVTVSVGDNGGGITPQNLVRIFDPFFTTKASGRGSGLGLSIVRSIVEDHGGRIWARSVVGKGTDFLVEFPPRKPT